MTAIAPETRKPVALAGQKILRRVCLNLHLYSGMAALLFGIIFGLTGAVLAFDRQIEDWLTRDLTDVAPGPLRLPLTHLMQDVTRAYPGFEVVAIRRPLQEQRALVMLLAQRTGKRRLDIYVDDHTGKILGSCGLGCTIMEQIQKLHTSLLIGRPGVMVMGYATAVLLFLVCSGVYLWWKRKLLTINPRLRLWRINFDFHNALGFYIAPLLVVFAVTGMAIAFQWPRNLLTKLNAPGSSEGPRNRPASTVIAGTSRRSLDDQIASVELALPGLKVSAINLPRRSSDADMIFMTPISSIKAPPRATIAYLDQYSGRLLRVWTSSEFGLGSRILSYNVPLHTGSIWGWPTQVLMCLASLGVAALSVSGILIWWKREVR